MAATSVFAIVVVITITDSIAIIIIGQPMPVVGSTQHICVFGSNAARPALLPQTCDRALVFEIDGKPYCKQCTPSLGLSVSSSSSIQTPSPASSSHWQPSSVPKFIYNYTMPDWPQRKMILKDRSGNSTQSKADRFADLKQALHFLLSPTRQKELEGWMVELDELTDDEDEDHSTRDTQERRLLKRHIIDARDVGIQDLTDSDDRLALQSIPYHTRLIGSVGVAKLKYFDNEFGRMKHDRCFVQHIKKIPLTTKEMWNIIP
jgi:hypothetical protein